MGAARPSAPQSSNIKSGIAKGVRSTVNDPATRPEEEEGEREREEEDAEEEEEEDFEV